MTVAQELPSAMKEAQEEVLLKRAMAEAEVKKTEQDKLDSAEFLIENAREHRVGCWNWTRTMRRGGI